MPNATRPTRIWILGAFLIGFSAIGSGLIAAAVLTHQNPPRPLPSGEPRVIYQTSMVVEQVMREVYPFSIVPGGAENLDEAKQSIKDAAIDLANLRQVKLKKNLSGYVSYRWGGEIYWTSRPLTLRVGETVFTDGVHLVRGNCLNSYSPFPMLPIRPDEPTEQILDTPMEIPAIAYSFMRIPVFAPELPPSPEALTPAVPIFAPSTPGGGVTVMIASPGYRLTPPVILRLPNLSTEKLQPSGTSVVEP